MKLAEARSGSRTTTSSSSWRSSSIFTARPRPRRCRLRHLEDMLTTGAGFAGFALWGFGMGPHGPDYMAVGDLGTLCAMPWMPGFARMVCDGHVHGKP